MTISAFDRLTIDQIIESLAASLMVYEQVQVGDKDVNLISKNGQTWCRVHDLLSWGFGFYGDLDLNMDEYKKTLHEQVFCMENTSQFSALISRFAQAHEDHEDHLDDIEQRKKDGWSVIKV